METPFIKQENIILINDYVKEDKTEEKTEDLILDEEEGEYDCFTKPFSPNLATTKPMEGLNEAGPTPFLKKTFEMVEDPTTNEIISWSCSKKSFIVWDYHHFSTYLLPKHFKHSNFSSFIRQLNTYGFKKIDPDRWEFANDGFQGGKKHMLKNIKRRKQITQTNSGFEAEIKILNNDRRKLKMEISKLKHQQETTQGCLTAIKERLEKNENKQQQMFAFILKAFSNPGFLENFIKTLRHKDRNYDNTPVAKKQKVIKEKQNHEDFATMESETENLYSPPLDGEVSSESEGQKGKCTSSISNLGSENYISWEKLWENESICETRVWGEVEFGENDNKLEVDLENLFTKPSDHWTNYMKDMVVQIADDV